MPTPTQDIKFTYGSLVMGGDSADYTVDAGPSLSQKPSSDGGPATASVSWTIFVQNSDRATFATRCAAIEDEFEKRFLDLAVEIDGVSFLSWSHSGNTGFNAEPNWSIIPDSANTGFSRRYALSVSVGLPAEDNSQIRSAEATISSDASDKTRVTFSGTYTATSGGVDALATYNSGVGSYCSGILTGISGTFELLEEAPVRLDQDKACPWRRVYGQILFPQAQSTTDHPAIRDHSVQFTRETPGPGDTPGGKYTVSRLTTAHASYFCNVRQSVTTDLESLWTGTLRSYVLNEAKSRFNASVVAVTVDSLKTDPTTNTVAASLSLTMQTKGSTAFSYTVVQEYTDDPGTTFRRVHQGSERHAKHVYTGPADSERRTTVTAVLNSLEALGKVSGLGSLSSNEASINGGSVPPPKSRGWVEVPGRTKRIAPIQIGIPGIGTKINASQVTIMIPEVWVVQPQAITFASPSAPKASGPPQGGQFQQPGGSSITPAAGRSSGVDNLGGGYTVSGGPRV